MAVSIKDIARLAGVSHSTVSRALRNSPLIPSTTAERIQKIAAEAGYTVSAIARSLVTNRTQAVGVVVTSIADPFNGEVVAGIESTANKNGYSVILANSQADPEREVRVVRSVHERRVDGILIASSRVGSLYGSMLSELNVPIVFLNNQHEADLIRSVSIDNEEGAYEATRHLIALGHCRIAYLGDRFGLHSDEERYAGYRRALGEAKLCPGKQFVLRGDGKPEGGAAAAHQFLDLPERPTAIFCYNDMTALGVMQEASERKLSIPRDLSIVGFDDLFFARLLVPALTTVRQPKEELGKQAMEMLLSVLSSEDTEKAVTVKGELVVRASTGPCRA
jgi:DNA-binding LacI/PurR family transcriptional regulator